MSNPLLAPDKFAPASGPPTTWPGGQPSGPPSGAPFAPPPGMAGGSFPPPHPGGTAPPPPRPGSGSGSGSGGTLRRQGVASATAVLLAIIAVVGVVGWNLVTTRTEVGVNAQGQVVEQTTADIPAWVIGALVVGLGLVIVTFFRPMWARFTAPLYAVAEGLLIGAISKVYEVRFEGIVLQAVGLTLGIFTMMLVLYATGRIRVTPRLRLGIIAATGGIALIYRRRS
jgi:hypothetical protein